MMWDLVIYGTVLLGGLITTCVYFYKSRRAEISIIVREKARVARVSVKCKIDHANNIQNTLKTIFKESDINIT